MGDDKDREALISLTQACLSPSSGSWTQPHTPQYLLATLIPSPGKLTARYLCWGAGAEAAQCNATLMGM